MTATSMPLASGGDSPARSDITGIFGIVSAGDDTSA
jgi:hypothetical protein